MTSLYAEMALKLMPVEQHEALRLDCEAMWFWNKLVFGGG
jgi:hypothetical protein